MKRTNAHSFGFFLALCILSAAAKSAFGQGEDSSALIFNESQIYTYQIEFYDANWEDSLFVNYQNGEAYMPARFTYGDLVLDSIGVRYKGNSSFIKSMNSRKKPLKFRFDKYKDYRFYGMKRLNFSNCVQDPSFMRETIAYKIARKYQPAPRTAYANIYIQGEHIGFYVQVEQVDEIFLSRHFQYGAFNLYKASDHGANLEYMGAEQQKYEVDYELKTNKHINDWSAFIRMLEKLNNTPSDVFYDTLLPVLNLDGCVRHLAFNMVLSHFDSYTGSGRNFYFYDDASTEQFHIIPWDLNETFGSFTNGWDVLAQDIVNIPNLDKRPLNRKILEHSALRQLYFGYIGEMINGSCAGDSIAAMADHLKPLIDGHVKADTNKLYTYDEFVSNVEEDVSLGPMGSIPGIKSFSSERNENLRTQLAEYLTITTGERHAPLNTLSIQTVRMPGRSYIPIHYTIGAGNHFVKIFVSDSRGKKTTSLFEGRQSSGGYQFNWMTTGVSAGLYVVSMRYGYSTITKKVLIL